jgi:hypothetical protein
MFIIALSVVQVIPNSAEAGVDMGPTLMVILDSSNQDVNVSESSSGSVQFTGSVQIVDLRAECLLFVDISSSVDIGWRSQCSPNSMVITDTSAHNFSVSVVVPPGTLSNVVGILKVDEKVRNSGCGIINLQSPGLAIVTVKPYYRVRLAPVEPYKEVTPGEGTTFTIKVCNEGNAFDSYSVSVENLKRLHDEGWTINADISSFEKMEPGGNRTWKIIVEPPKGRILWTDEATTITIRAQSLNAKEEGRVVGDNIRVVVVQHYTASNTVPQRTTLWIAILLGISIAWIEKTRPGVPKRGAIQ